jgi:hypothetical protein
MHGPSSVTWMLRNVESRKPERRHHPRNTRRPRQGWTTGWACSGTFYCQIDYEGTSLHESKCSALGCSVKNLMVPAISITIPSVFVRLRTDPVALLRFCRATDHPLRVLLCTCGRRHIEIPPSRVVKIFDSSLDLLFSYH